MGYAKKDIGLDGLLGVIAASSGKDLLKTG